MPCLSNKIENLKQAAEEIYGRLPALHQIVDCYLQIFILQEMFATGQTEPPGPHPAGNGFRPGYDLQACQGLLLKLCRLDFSGNQTLARSGDLLATAIETGKFAPGSLFDTIIARDQDRLEELSSGLKMDPALMAFWGYHGLRPTLVQAAGQTENFRQQDDGPAATCPVCGSAPALAVLEKDGSRRLYCSFCWYNWRVKRLACLFCGKNSQDANLYFYEKSLPQWRVDFCQDCRHYLKTVDLRKLKRYFYPPLENIASLPLDLKAEKENLQPVHTGWMPGLFV